MNATLTVVTDRISAAVPHWRVLPHSTTAAIWCTEEPAPRGRKVHVTQMPRTGRVHVIGRDSESTLTLYFSRQQVTEYPGDAAESAVLRLTRAGFLPHPAAPAAGQTAELALALALAGDALNNANGACVHHGVTPPTHSPRGLETCALCVQPGRVRAARAALDALTLDDVPDGR